MKKMKNGSFLFSLLVISTLFFLSGCFSSIAKTQLPDIDLPQEKQVKNITQYDDVLYCMDRLYEILQERHYGLDDDTLTSVYIRPIINQTANKKAIPEEIKIMLITSLNKLGNHIRILSEEPIGDENYYILEAAVTEFDTISTQSANINAGVSFGKGKGESDLDGQGGYKKKLANIAIDFNIIDAQKKIYEPYVSTSYKMKITKISDSNDYSIYIGNQGIGLYANATKQQGIMGAIRLLIEVSLAELFGEHDILPYWTCTGAKIDRQMKNVVRHFYNRAKVDNSLNNYAVYYLGLWGLVDEKRVDQPSLNQAIVKFKKIHRLPPYNSEITEELFFALLTKVPPKTREGHNIDLFEKYNEVSNIKVYKEALTQEKEVKFETTVEQHKKIESLVYLFQSYKRKYPNAKLVISSFIDDNNSLQVAQDNINIIYKILIDKGINRTEIITRGIKTNVSCDINDQICKFQNTYYTFEFQN